MDIFISYSRKDFKVVSKIAQKVSDAGYSVWMDVDGIESGDEFKSKIAFAIKNSKLFLFFSSLASNKSEWTVKEVNYAIKKKIPIIPIRLDNADYNDSVDFDLAGLDFIQYDDALGIDFVIQKLMRSLEKKVKPSIKKNVSVNKETLSSSCTATLDKGGASKDVKVTGGNDAAKNIGKIVLAVMGVIVVFGCIVFALGNNTSTQRDESPVLDSLAILKRQFEDSIAKIKYEQFRKDSIAEQTRLENERKQREAERIAAEKHKKQQLQAKKTIINAHEAIDLGLPSGIKWAACNVGANSPEECGGYYAWGETEEKSNYYWITYKWCNGSFDTMTKYCTESDYGTVDNKTVLDPEDDVARVKWGGSWRMPTNAEQDELRNKCTWEWTTQNGVNGYRVAGPNGNSIFLPAAGCRNGAGIYDIGGYGDYWSSSLNSGNSYYAYYLFFYDNYYDWGYSNRHLARSVRPVSE